MLLLLYFLPLLFKVWQRSGACCCYIVYHYCLRFDWSGSCCCWYIVYHYCLRFDRGVIHVVVGYIVYHFCLMYDRGVIDIVVGYNVYHDCFGLTEEWFMWLLLYCLPLLFKVWKRSVSCCCCCLYCLPLLFKVWQRSGSCCCCYIVYHYCLRFHREVVHSLFFILSTITV